MATIYVTEKINQRYGVTFQNNGYIKAQKFEDISDEKNIIYNVKPMETFFR